MRNYLNEKLALHEEASLNLRTRIKASREIDDCNERIRQEEQKDERERWQYFTEKFLTDTISISTNCLIELTERYEVLIKKINE